MTIHGRILGALMLAALAIVVVATILELRETWRREAAFSRYTNLRALALCMFANGKIAYPLVYASPTGEEIISWRLVSTFNCIPTPNTLDLRRRWDSQDNKQLAYLHKFFDLSSSEFGPPSVALVVGPGSVVECLEAQKSCTGVVMIETKSLKSCWMAPGDVPLAELRENGVRPICEVTGKHLAGGVHIVFSDGDVWLLDGSTPTKCIADFCDAETAVGLGREQVFRIYARARNGVLCSRNEEADVR